MKRAAPIGITDWVSWSGTHVSETRLMPSSTVSTSMPAQAISAKKPMTSASPTMTPSLRSAGGRASRTVRSEEHTSELQSLMRISYAVFCLKKKKQNNKYRELYNIVKNNKIT